MFIHNHRNSDEIVLLYEKHSIVKLNLGSYTGIQNQRKLPLIKRAVSTDSGSMTLAC